MLDDPQYQHAIRWADSAGTIVEVHRKNIISVLPTFFSAKATWTSFNRQMTAYQFQRDFGTNDTVQFHNALFLRDQQHLAVSIKSKHSKRKKPSESVSTELSSSFDPESLFLKFEREGPKDPNSIEELQRSIMQLKIMNQNIVDLQHMMMRTLHDFVTMHRASLLSMLIEKFRRLGKPIDPAQGICPLMATLAQSDSCAAVPKEHFEQHPEFMKEHIYEMTRPFDDHEPHNLVSGKSRSLNLEWETNADQAELTDYALHRDIDRMMSSVSKTVSKSSLAVIESPDDQTKSFFGTPQITTNHSAPSQSSFPPQKSQMYQQSKPDDAPVFVPVQPLPAAVDAAQTTPSFTQPDMFDSGAVAPMQQVMQSHDPLLNFEDYLIQNTQQVLERVVDGDEHQLYNMVRADWQDEMDFGNVSKLFDVESSDDSVFASGNSSDATQGDSSPFGPKFMPEDLPPSPLYHSSAIFT